MFLTTNIYCQSRCFCYHIIRLDATDFRELGYFIDNTFIISDNIGE